jgi:hypothetical protein
MNSIGALVDVALGIQEAVKLAAGQTPVDELDSADFDDSVPLPGRETRGFGVEDDLSHRLIRP